MRYLLALLLAVSIPVSAETLVQHCATLTTESCTSSTYLRPADASMVRVMRAGAPWVALGTVLPTERISVCVDDPSVAIGTAGPCTTRVAGRSDNWQLKSVVYAAPVPPAPPTVTGNVLLSWVPPTLNDDGSTLTDLAGYRIYYGKSDAFGQSITLTNPGLASYELKGLATGTWYFAMTAVNTAGLESDQTATVSHALMASEPPPETCTSPKPEETRPMQCVAPAVGAWDQTRAVAWAAYPTCWTVGEWLPATAPSGACVTPTITYKVAPVSSGRRPVYEPVQNIASTATVRGTVQGHVPVGTACGELVFQAGTTRYHYVTESDVTLDSPTYRGREHVAICTR